MNAETAGYTVPPNFGVLLYHAWQNYAPAPGAFEVTDYQQLFGDEANWFEGLITEAHFQVALMNAAIHLHQNPGYTAHSYPEDIAFDPPPYVVADAIHRCAKAILALYWDHPGDLNPVSMNDGPFPMGTKVHVRADRYDSPEVYEVHGYAVIKSKEVDPDGEQWTHGLKLYEVAYKVREVDGVTPFWVNQNDLSPEGSY